MSRAISPAPRRFSPPRLRLRAITHPAACLLSLLVYHALFAPAAAVGIPFPPDPDFQIIPLAHQDEAQSPSRDITPSPTPSDPLAIDAAPSTDDEQLTPSPSTCVSPTPSAPTGGPSESPFPSNTTAGPNDTIRQGQRSCFPADVTVQVRGVGHVRMDRLQVGHLIWTRDGWSRVFMFTHRVRGGWRRFVRVRTYRGGEVVLSGGHVMLVRGGVKKAREVGLGDWAWADGEWERVVHVDTVWRSGLYNPQTMGGEIVVGGVAVTTYTEAIGEGAAHGLLAPLRWLFSVAGVSWKGLEDGLEGLFGRWV